jgi:sRNA-binding regulator protein Hfq
MLITVKNIKTLLINGLKLKKIIHNFKKMWIIIYKNKLQEIFTKS